MKIIKHVGVLLLLTLALTDVTAQDQHGIPTLADTLTDSEAITDTAYANDQAREEAPIVYDSAAVSIRSFDTTRLHELREEPAMDYGQDTPAAVSLWERLKIWLRHVFRLLFHVGESTRWGNIALGIVAVLVLTYVILRLLRIDALKILRRSSAGMLRQTALEEDIHVMDFEKLIAEALANSAYRLAIRLTFLHSLKILADGHYIQWEPGKTNHDYMTELTTPDLKAGFGTLNFFFDYAWYGNFVITREHYERVNGIFTHWKTNIR